MSRIRRADAQEPADGDEGEKAPWPRALKWRRIMEIRVRTSGNISRKIYENMLEPMGHVYIYIYVIRYTYVYTRNGFENRVSFLEVPADGQSRWGKFTLG